MKTLNEWECPSCNKLHRGFKKQQCQNPHCDLFKPYQEAQTMATTKTTKTVTTKATKSAGVKTPKASVKKAASKTKSPSEATSTTKKKPAKKEATPTKTKAPKTTENLSAKEAQALRASKPIKWSERRIAVVEALRSLGATKSDAAVSADDIVKASKMDMTVQQCKICCDRYRGGELVAQGYVDTAKIEQSRGLHYYLTDEGKKTKFGSP